ncbi:MAG: PPK2 family polyphosphate kinase [Melioribacteraceae bacterium]
MDYSKQFIVEPGSSVQLKDYETQFSKKQVKKKSTIKKTKKLEAKMGEIQARLFAENKHSLLIILQALDAGGKDGVVRHVIGSMNPHGCRVVNFKQPTPKELAHDFLWRIKHNIPNSGEVVVFNRSQYEDVLIVRVHDLVPKEVWSTRYEQINKFEQHLISQGTHILKFFLHISKKEQMRRFKKRLEDPTRQWKINETDYTDREYWADYQTAYEEVFNKCSTTQAPWFIIPSDKKWFRNLAISQIIVETLDKLAPEFPEPKVNIKDIYKRYHNVKRERKKDEKKER